MDADRWLGDDDVDDDDDGMTPQCKSLPRHKKLACRQRTKRTSSIISDSKDCIHDVLVLVLIEGRTTTPAMRWVDIVIIDDDELEYRFFFGVRNATDPSSRFFLDLCPVDTDLCPMEFVSTGHNIQLVSISLRRNQYSYSFQTSLALSHSKQRAKPKQQPAAAAP